MRVFANGLLTGLVLQLAIGPVFFFIINISLQNTLLDGLAGVMAVTLVDYLYITLAIVGVGKLLETQKCKKIFGIVSSIVLIVFGVMLVRSILSNGIVAPITTHSINLVTSFASVFVLTISSPMTIVWYTSLFTAKAIAYNYKKKELVLFGLAIGLTTLLFMGTSVTVFSLLRGTVPPIVIQVLNIIVGCILIGYGVIQITKTLNQRIEYNND